jgi:hypothetical protein
MGADGGGNAHWAERYQKDERDNYGNASGTFP